MVKVEDGARVHRIQICRSKMPQVGNWGNRKNYHKTQLLFPSLNPYLPSAPSQNMHTQVVLRKPFPVGLFPRQGYSWAEGPHVEVINMPMPFSPTEFTDQRPCQSSNGQRRIMGTEILLKKPALPKHTTFLSETFHAHINLITERKGDLFSFCTLLIIFCQV